MKHFHFAFLHPRKKRAVRGVYSSKAYWQVLDIHSEIKSEPIRSARHTRSSGDVVAGVSFSKRRAAATAAEIINSVKRF